MHLHICMSILASLYWIHHTLQLEPTALHRIQCQGFASGSLMTRTSNLLFSLPTQRFQMCWTDFLG